MPVPTSVTPACTSPSEPTWLFPRVWSLGLVLLVAASWPLWFPGSIPQVPMIPLLPLLPAESLIGWWLGHLAAAAMLFGLLAILWFPNRLRSLWWVVAGCLMLGFVVDQHRLQPWAYQSAIYALVFATMDRVSATRWLIPLAASVYIYSAWGKLDYQFAHTVGQDFLRAATRPIGGLPVGFHQSQLAGLALLFPGVELLAGVGLLWNRTRRVAAMLVIAIHLGLIAMLGPWNRDHSLGVLIWNALLIAQALLLLIPQPPRAPRLDARPDPSAPGLRHLAWLPLAVRLLIILVITAPLLERSGYFDHWTSWSLYSPHTSHADIEIHQSAIDRLDPLLQAQLRENREGDGWYLLEAGRWSLAARRVPVYPQARYQLALAGAIAKRHQLREEIRARLASVSDRFNGRRSYELLPSAKAIDARLRDFWLRPRMETGAPSDAHLLQDVRESAEVFGQHRVRFLEPTS